MKNVKLIMETWRRYLNEIRTSDFSDFEETAGSTHPIYRGSYQEKSHFIKFPDNELQTLNEFLAYRIYSLYDVKIPDSFYLVFNDEGKVGISTEEFKGGIYSGRVASKIDLPLYDAFNSTLGNMFYVDSFLANWDAAKNVVVDFDKFSSTGDFDYRSIDPGGALDFRAQGERKGHMFSDDVGELETLLDPKITRGTGASYVYSKRDDNLAKEKFTKVSWNDISQMIESTKQDIIEELIDHERDDLISPFRQMADQAKLKLQKRHNFILQRLS